jgi:hypothetical protein
MHVRVMRKKALKVATLVAGNTNKMVVVLMADNAQYGLYIKATKEKMPFSCLSYHWIHYIIFILLK